MGNATRQRFTHMLDCQRSVSTAEQKAADRWFKGLSFAQIVAARMWSARSSADRSRFGPRFCVVRGSFRDATDHDLKIRLADLKFHRREDSPAARALVRELRGRNGLFCVRTHTDGPSDPRPAA